MGSYFRSSCSVYKLSVQEYKYISFVHSISHFTKIFQKNPKTVKNCQKLPNSILLRYIQKLYQFSFVVAHTSSLFHRYEDWILDLRNSRLVQYHKASALSSNIRDRIGAFAVEQLERRVMDDLHVLLLSNILFDAMYSVRCE
jgi:hypothetical protein